MTFSTINIWTSCSYQYIKLIFLLNLIEPQIEKNKQKIIIEILKTNQQLHLDRNSSREKTELLCEISSYK